MGKKVREYKTGDFIFAKVKGYPAWPARVQKQNGKKYLVYFYGTGETANLPPNMIFDYVENKDKLLNKSVKRKDFNDGVKQIEHDFANNVPLEQVVGALAEAEPASADDTVNESTASDTVDDSTIADTTADETMDESVANAANDAPVEDSDETGALVIDEGKQKGRKSAAKTPATPKAVKELKTPRGRPKREEAKEVEDEEKRDEEIVSRSGRKIRPKRYMDEQTEENSTLPSPAPKKRRGASPSAEKDKEKTQEKNIRAYNTVQQSELRELKEPFKSADAEKENILIAYLPSGEYCGVKLFQSRPVNFKSEASRLQWDKQAASNAITLKRQLEKGQITPQSISAQLVMDLSLTSEEKATLDKDRDLELKKSRLHFLKTEMKLIELDAKIKTCLSLEKADTELCLKLIDEILELDLAALMLLKHPTCMETVKRMRVYVGNAPSWEMSEGEALTFSKQAHRIRHKADALFVTMRDLFDMPDGISFSEFFSERVAQFKAATENLHADKLLEMVHEPIEMSQPAAHTMKAAIDAANEETAETEEAPKKKATPAKGKKANNTPSKTPLKRQSSRKQQQEDKEKEKETEKKTEDTPEDTETNKSDETDKPVSNETPKETNANNDDSEKPNENDTDEADKEVAKVNESSEKYDETEPEKKNEEKSDGDNEKKNEDSPKEKVTNSKEKSDKADKSEENELIDKNFEEKEEKSPKDSKKAKESEKHSNSDKNSKSKDKKDEKQKDDVKNSKESKGGKTGDKRKDKGKDEKEKSEEKEKVDVDEPRAKRSRESKKTDPPPRSPAKRKSKS